MTKEEFKKEWEKEDCNITFEDIAQCAVEWGLYQRPKTSRIHTVANRVLEAAGCDPFFAEEDDDD